MQKSINKGLFYNIFIKHMYDGDLQNLSEEDKKRKRSSIQMQMVILESDGRKLINEKNMLDAEIRNLRMDQERLRITAEEKQKRYNDMDFKISQNEEEIKRLKKQLNLL